MPLFFFLSGAVFAIKPIESWTFESVLIKKFIRLLVPYFLVFTLFSTPLRTLSGFYSVSALPNVIMSGLNTPLTSSGHLWFLPTLFWCFVIFYPLAKYLKDKYFLILLICMLLMGVADKIPSINIPLWCNAFSYIFWFGLGYVFHHYRIPFNKFLDGPGIILVTAAGILSIISCKLHLFNDFYQIMMSTLFIYGCCYYLSKLAKLKKNRLYNSFSKHSFDIYLYHDPMNYILLYSVYNTGLYRYFSSWIVVSLWFLIRIFGNIVFASYLGCLFKNIYQKFKCISFSSRFKYIALVLLILITVGYMFAWPLIKPTFGF